MKRKRQERIERRVEIQYVTRALVPVKIKRYHILCPMCGEWFFAKRSDAICCSGRCRSRAFRERHEDAEHHRRMQETEPLFGAQDKGDKPCPDMWKAFPWSTGR